MLRDGWSKIPLEHENGILKFDEEVVFDTRNGEYHIITVKRNKNQEAAFYLDYEEEITDEVEKFLIPLNIYYFQSADIDGEDVLQTPSGRRIISLQAPRSPPPLIKFS